MQTAAPRHILLDARFIPVFAAWVGPITLALGKARAIVLVMDSPGICPSPSGACSDSAGTCCNWGSAAACSSNDGWQRVSLEQLQHGGYIAMHRTDLGVNSSYQVHLIGCKCGEAQLNNGDKGVHTGSGMPQHSPVNRVRGRPPSCAQILDGQKTLWAIHGSSCLHCERCTPTYGMPSIHLACRLIQ